MKKEMKKYKILNLYAGIGGNRKLWNNPQFEITAVEINPEIAKVYKDYFPDDTVIIDNAHEYLLKHFKEFDFIWSSPPCQSHSRFNVVNFINGHKKYVYPDAKLWQEIIFLKQWFLGKFVIENVIGYYEPLIPPTGKIERHYFWANFNIGHYKPKKRKELMRMNIKELEHLHGFDLKDYDIENKRQCLRNCVTPEIAAYIINRAFDIHNEEKIPQGKLFNNI